jgi:hypothetical protein
VSIAFPVNVTEATLAKQVDLWPCGYCIFLPTKPGLRDICPTRENIHTKGAQTWTPQKEINAKQRERERERQRERVILKQTHFSVNNDMQQQH